MSLFSRLRNSGSAPEAPVAKAVLTPAVSAMIADGEVDNSETAQLANICSFSPIFFQMEESRLKQLIMEVIEEIGAKGHEKTIADAAGALSPALRETALCFAARIAFADGRIDDGEKASLSQTGYHMQISPETFKKIVDVIAMLQRPPTA